MEQTCERGLSWSIVTLRADAPLAPLAAAATASCTAAFRLHCCLSLLLRLRFRHLGFYWWFIACKPGPSSELAFIKSCRQCPFGGANELMDIHCQRVCQSLLD